MDLVALGAGLAVGLAIGAAVMWVLGKGSRAVLESRCEDAQRRIADQSAELTEVGQRLEVARSTLSETTAEVSRLSATIEERDKAHEARLEAYKTAEEQLKDTFTALSSEALKESTKQLTGQAEQILARYKETADADEVARKQGIDSLLKPLKESLEKLDVQNQTMESKRAGAYGELTKQVEQLALEQTRLNTETSRLVKALQDPGSAGTWGEMVLERVIEMAGLEEHTSFAKQETFQSEEGAQRPDMIVRLPGQRALIIDSKAPMRAYLEGLETADDANRDVLFKSHAQKLLNHAKELKKRDYSKGLDAAIDFVLLFVPSESAFRVALEHRPALIEEAHECNVVIATPMTLLALLRAVSYGWRQERLAQSAMQLQKDASVLYDRLSKVAGDVTKLGQSLDQAGKRYNEFVASLERRVMPQARKLREHGVGSASQEIAPLEQIAVVTRNLTALDAKEPSDSLF